MSFTKTVSEFSTSRKIRYGGNESRNNSGALKTLNTNLRSPLSYDQESFTPHTATYKKDSNGNDIYVIEFNIGAFQFDELTIRTDSNRLFVKGNSKQAEDSSEEINREFKREFKLPKEVDENTIKAELDEKTRLLRLVGQVTEQIQRNTASIQQASYSSMSSDKFNADVESYNTFHSATELSIGNVKEVKSTNLLEYEVYLGNELKDAQVIFEVPNKNTLNIRCTKNGSDANGSLNLELKREIKLPFGARLNNIDHGIDSRTKTLIIKVPLS